MFWHNHSNHKLQTYWQQYWKHDDTVDQSGYIVPYWLISVENVNLVPVNIWDDLNDFRPCKYVVLPQNGIISRAVYTFLPYIVLIVNRSKWNCLCRVLYIWINNFLFDCSVKASPTDGISGQYMTGSEDGTIPGTFYANVRRPEDKYVTFCQSTFNMHGTVWLIGRKEKLAYTLDLHPLTLTSGTNCLFLCV